MNKVKDSVKREIVINAPLEQVWDALTKAEHLNRWYTKSAAIDFRVGGKGYMNHGWGATTEGIFTEIDPMKCFVLQSMDGDFTTITSIEKVENGTRVSIEYQASFIAEIDQGTKENMLFGTGQFLENLKSVYEKGTDIRSSFWKTSIGIAHATEHSNSGTRVLKVKDDSVALKAGIKPEDIIVEVDGEEIDGYDSFERTLNNKTVNSIVTLTIIRNNEKIQLNCLVDAYPIAY
ncbi:SRPBCC domain-containing protein [Caldibacillus lycopersici]|uniref:SRPBCC domain-containing protein n=1 Tax=Perspicuibacillus lycopersici TaxID=1325689 RepID=A0AAE3LMG7_9BACI|nr:SRPBCC domain-containing protein [Perspicuibacillus lycopersici]MCU9612717.1 SRPBCC domain-containing protein [Perspicuibacillus lycopersici]